jgi:hypothetical protein
VASAGVWSNDCCCEAGYVSDYPRRRGLFRGRR